MTHAERKVVVGREPNLRDTLAEVEAEIASAEPHYAALCHRRDELLEQLAYVAKCKAELTADVVPAIEPEPEPEHADVTAHAGDYLDAPSEPEHEAEPEREQSLVGHIPDEHVQMMNDFLPGTFGDTAGSEDESLNSSEPADHGQETKDG